MTRFTGIKIIFDNRTRTLSWREQARYKIKIILWRKLAIILGKKKIIYRREKNNLKMKLS